MRAKIFAEENRKWWTLGSLCFALFMIMLDNTVVNVALPAIKADLGITTSELEWTVAADGRIELLRIRPVVRLHVAAGRQAAPRPRRELVGTAA